MNDDDFLDKLLNSSGDDLDRLIKNDQAKKKRTHTHDEIEVDMSDIEKILNSKPPLQSIPKNNEHKRNNTSKMIEISSSEENFPNHSEECFKQIYEQLTTETYCIDRLSALQKSSQHENRMRITSIVIKIILVGIGISICLGGAIWISQILFKLFPI